jgi:hypothetical protein
MEHLIEYYEALIKHKKEYIDADGELKYEKLVEINVLASVIKDLKKYGK